ncbi:hypothetical protein ACB092_03G210300 [Castanea dentata]
MSRNRKRDKPYFSRHVPASLSKRRRPHPPRHDGGDDEGGDVIEDKPIQKPAPPPALVVTGLPAECSVLDLKSRFEIYGSISRIRIVDRDGLAYVMYRAKDSAEAAIAASLDPSFGITIDSRKLQVVWATDPLVQWREGVGVGANKDNASSSSSKLLRAEVPLSRHGRGNKLASAVVNPRSNNNEGSSSVLDVPFRGREIVAYDDIL